MSALAEVAQGPPMHGRIAGTYADPRVAAPAAVSNHRVGREEPV